uniref:CSON015442 protein n=1 Tax=Culicoides sonorensis TaxID=179676 RepID=A0A336K9F3_CULSO
MFINPFLLNQIIIPNNCKNNDINLTLSTPITLNDPLKVDVFLKNGLSIGPCPQRPHFVLGFPEFGDRSRIIGNSSHNCPRTTAGSFDGTRIGGGRLCVL